MTTVINTVLLFAWCFFVIVESKKQELTGSFTSQMLDRLRTNYSRDEPPTAVTGDPTTVSISIYVNSLKVDPQKSEYSLVMYFRQSWMDPRLRFSKGRVNDVRIPEGTLDKVWIPDVFIRNAVDVKYYDVPVQHKLLKIDQNGKVWYAQKFSAVLSSPMAFQAFPYDTHRLHLTFESFGHTMDTLVVKPMEQPFELSLDLIIRDFGLTGKEVVDCSLNYTSGSYPCVEFAFLFKRDFGYRLLSVYLSSALFVVLSWFVFWIDHEASTVRLLTALLVLMILNLIQGRAFASSSVPEVPYMTSLDIWFIVCNAFVFATLLEYIVITILSRLSNDSKGWRILKPPSHDQKHIEMMMTGNERHCWWIGSQESFFQLPSSCSTLSTGVLTYSEVGVGGHDNHIVTVIRRQDSS